MRFKRNKGISRKVTALLAAIAVCMATVPIMRTEVPVSAATAKTVDDYNVSVEYDKTQYTMHVISRQQVKCYCQYGSTSTISGQVVYRMEGEPGDDDNGFMINQPWCIAYDIRFGAGNLSTGKVANRGGLSTNREMSIETKSIWNPSW